MNEGLQLVFEKLNLTHVQELIAISRLTYFETFAWGNTEENMRAYLDEAFCIEQLTAELEDENSEFYFGRIEDVIVGYIKMSWSSSQVEFKEEGGMELARIYVINSFQGSGYGKQILLRVIDLAREQGKNFLWLGVWEKNQKALRFYEKFGFEKVGTHSFHMGEDEQTDYLMRLAL